MSTSPTLHAQICKTGEAGQLARNGARECVVVQPPVQTHTTSMSSANAHTGQPVFITTASAQKARF